MSQFTGSVYELVLKGNLYASQLANVFHYGVSLGSGSADDLCSQFASSILPHIQTILSADVNLTHIDARGVQAAFDFDQNGITEVGDIADNAEPAFVAWSYKLIRPDSLSRNGYKRFAGCPDAWWETGGIDPTVLPILASVATFLAAGFSSGPNGYVPLIKRTQHLGAPVDPPTFWTFGAATFLGISTQNSRKV